MVLSLKSITLLLSVILLKLILQTNSLTTTLGEKQYFIGLTDKVNWYRAAQICSTNDMTLASIESATEQDALAKYLFSQSLLTNGYWLSGNDLASSKNFIWLSSGNAFGYTNWTASEPASGTLKRCVQTNVKLEWAVDSCVNRHYYICSRPLIPECGATGRCALQ